MTGKATTRARAAWLAGTSALIVAAAITAALVIRHGGVRHAAVQRPATGPAPTQQQVAKLAAMATSGDCTRVARAFSGLTAKQVPAPLAHQLAAIARLRAVPGSIRPLGDNTATALLIGQAGGKQVRDRVILHLEHGRWLIVTGTSQ